MPPHLYRPVFHLPESAAPVLRNKRYLLLILLLAPLLSAAQVTLKGQAKAFAGKAMVAFYYEDYITYTRHILQADTVHPDGSFQLRFDAKNTGRIYLRCDHLKAPLYIEPEKTYDVFFPAKDSSRLINQNIDQDGDLSFNSSDTTDLNWLIIDFNNRFDDFWRKKYQKFVLKQMRVPLDSFRHAITKHYENIKKPYFHSYIDYSIASTRVSTLESENFLSKDYLDKRPILYSNYEYMVFFNQFFDKAFYQFALSPKGAAVYDAINESGSFSNLLAALKPAPYVDNDTLRELFLLKGLYENYNNKEFKQARMMAILQEAAKLCKVPEHRLIARNIISHYTLLKRGAMAPPFTLQDMNGKTVSLTDFKGKYVYLSFGASWCTTCISEWKMMEDLQKQYPLFRLVTIITDDQVADIKKLIKQNPHLSWTFLNAGSNEQVKHDYNIYSVPYHYLINPKGQLILSPAPGPSDGLEDIFYKITKNKEDQIKVGDW